MPKVQTWLQRNHCAKVTRVGEGGVIGILLKGYLSNHMFIKTVPKRTGMNLGQRNLHLEHMDYTCLKFVLFGSLVL